MKSGEESLNPILLVAAVGAALGLVVFGWMYFARGDDEAVSSSGFSERGAAVPAPALSARREQSGLSFVGGIESGPPSGARPESEGVRNGAAASSPSAAAAEALSAAEQAEADKLGVPRSPGQMNNLGRDQNIFGSILNRLGRYPKIFGLVLNNRYVVDGFMHRESVSKMLGTPDGVNNFLSDLKNPQGISQRLPFFKSFLDQNPQAAQVIASSELVRQIINTPGAQGFVNNPGPAVAANPALMNLLLDSSVISTLASTPQAAESSQALQTLQSNLGAH